MRDFFKTEASSGVILLAAAAVALAVANSGAAETYFGFMHMKLGFLSLHQWINDGLMAIFFFVVGMEIKSEMTEGSLMSRARASLPIAGAVGGMIVPALVYLIFNSTISGHENLGARGWAIPMATDIAFAVGILSLFGNRIRPQLRIFLLALAIVDDLGAILVIAIFYTAQLRLDALFFAAGLVAVVARITSRFEKLRARPMNPQVAIGGFALAAIAVWFLVLVSGVHPTIAGCAMGFLVPKPRVWIDKFHGFSSFVIMPVFALANAAVPFGTFSVDQLLSDPVVSGVSYGLMIGKPAGIFLACWLAIRFKIASANFSMKSLLGVACLGGIGFTMSLFIAGLAFGESENLALAKIGILKGSLLSAVAGSILLFFFARDASRSARTKTPAQ